jgi:hypothetical protein
MNLAVLAEPQLHLDVSIRSLKAASYAVWVNHVVDGDAPSAAALASQMDFPILLTRHLPTLRRTLRNQTIGNRRSGLVASSQATRLRAEGLEPDSNLHAGYPWEHWYLAPPTDVRSSFQSEVFATEFEIQGLELDWIGLCWGGDYIWSPTLNTWLIRAFRPTSSRWTEVKSEARRLYRRNAYRVLLTRARQGIAIYIPAGDPTDPTRNPTELNDTATFLTACGAHPLEPPIAPADSTLEPQPDLFG